MVLYYLVRDVVAGANCSYQAGRTLLREAGFRFSDEARRVADNYNRHCNVAGVCYLVLPHPEDKPVQADHYENGKPSDYALDDDTFAIGEYRHTSAGNIFRLEAFDGVNSCTVRRVGIVGQENPQLWDADMTYRWTFCQWESIPLLGADTSKYPFFGKFIGQVAA